MIGRKTSDGKEWFDLDRWRVQACAASLRRWPPEKYPALYLGARELGELRARERQRRRILDLIGSDIAAYVLDAKEDSRDRKSVV